VNRSILKSVVFGTLSVGILTLASCEPKEPPTSTHEESRHVDAKKGEAGGVVTDTFIASTVITDIDRESRKVTLATESGGKASFTAGPEIRNFDQLKVGDKVSATVMERLVVFVRSGDDVPSVTHSAALAAAPRGAKPGALVAELFEVVATIKSIDTANRSAVLLFTDGLTITVPVRSDVDLSRYKVGDSVVIRVSETLTVLVNKP
jgi:Cu/Ag efflux protein CusF